MTVEILGNQHNRACIDRWTPRSQVIVGSRGIDKQHWKPRRQEGVGILGFGSPLCQRDKFPCHSRFATSVWQIGTVPVPQRRAGLRGA